MRSAISPGRANTAATRMPVPIYHPEGAKAEDVPDFSASGISASLREAPKDYPINLAERLISVPANSLEMGHFSLAV